MMFLLGLICGMWICSFVVLWIEIRQSPLVDDNYEMPAIRPRWESIE